jgi:pimeloyl-ACP methyl ester carboxylesterase
MTAESQSRHGYFTASDGIKIHYITLGERGSWVVLIHGYTDNAQRMFFDTGIAAALAVNHHVVAIDNRNHGLSDQPDVNGPGRAEDSIELMDHLKIQKAHIHGYSMGGALMAQLLVSHQERFVTAAFGGSGIQETDLNLRKKAALLDAPAPKPQGTEAEALQKLQAIVTARGVHAPPKPFEIDLATVKIPVLAINSEYDAPNAKTSRMARELAIFQIVILAGESHMSAAAIGGPMPSEYIESLVEFINAHDVSSI